MLALLVSGSQLQLTGSVQSRPSSCEVTFLSDLFPNFKVSLFQAPEVHPPLTWSPSELHLDILGEQEHNLRGGSLELGTVFSPWGLGLCPVQAQQL